MGVTYDSLLLHLHKTISIPPLQGKRPIHRRKNSGWGNFLKPSFQKAAVTPKKPMVGTRS